ncbi:MAG: glycine--tRNA ligase subunit beta [Desulfovibrio sp.]|jgi:glycyl-tRNA synthetase beta chain|nr:glycine--tRNA ligase subunit beta [Desulfovibrio sp.]
MPAFVLEVGMEEMPARFAADAEKALAERLGAVLLEAGPTFTGLVVCSSPRRLVAYIADLAETSAEYEEVVTGPSAKAAFDISGRPTRAAEGFAKTHGVPLHDLFTVETDKGLYIAVRKRMGGRRTAELLSELCPELILNLPFPKRMRWGTCKAAFVRPIRWILALLGNVHVPFAAAGIASGTYTYGHRTHGPGPFSLRNASEYFTVTAEQAGITVDGNARRRIITEQGAQAASEKQGKVLWNERLLQEIQGLCEHPVPILGSFSRTYLELPREVLLTSMEKHQKSFGVEGENGRLLPHFLTVLNLSPESPDLVRKGWERVLRARLEDARFFWKTDTACAGFDSWLAALETVIFLAPLGSMGDKSRRLERLCAYLAEHARCGLPEAMPSREDAVRAGRIAKADLVSEMVKEFDVLQGIMGGIYARRFGESPDVADGVAEQYLPAGPDTPTPATLCGALLSIADKADTLAGCFGLGMIPTGAADPYALRRAALGIARTTCARHLRFSVSALFAEALRGYGEREWKLEPDRALVRLQEFFNLRLKNLFTAEGTETLIAESVILSGADDIWAAGERATALGTFCRSEDFTAGVLTFKRAANILKKQAEEAEVAPNGAYDTALLEHDAEKFLAAELERFGPVFDRLWEADAYGELFALLNTLRPAVDAFFDGVMVMCDDAVLRLNRLNLLQALVGRLGRLADFSVLQI